MKNFKIKYFLLIIFYANLLNSSNKNKNKLLNFYLRTKEFITKENEKNIDKAKIFLLSSNLNPKINTILFDNLNKNYLNEVYNFNYEKLKLFIEYVHSIISSLDIENHSYMNELNENDINQINYLINIDRAKLFLFKSNIDEEIKKILNSFLLKKKNFSKEELEKFYKFVNVFNKSDYSDQKLNEKLINLINFENEEKSAIIEFFEKQNKKLNEKIRSEEYKTLKKG